MYFNTLFKFPNLTRGTWRLFQIQIYFQMKPFLRDGDNLHDFENQYHICESKNNYSDQTLTTVGFLKSPRNMILLLPKTNGASPRKHRPFFPFSTPAFDPTDLDPANFDPISHCASCGIRSVAIASWVSGQGRIRAFIMTPQVARMTIGWPR